MTTDTEIIERYFKARGWVAVESEDGTGDIVNWHTPDIHGREYFDPLPKILTDFSAFKEHVLEVMGEEDHMMQIAGDCIFWMNSDEMSRDEPQFTQREEVIDNNILHAAVIAATRYFEGKK